MVRLLVSSAGVRINGIIECKIMFKAAHRTFGVHLHGVCHPFSVATQLITCNGKSVATQEECYWAHACTSFEQAGMGTNSIIFNIYICNISSSHSELCERLVRWRTRVDDGTQKEAGVQRNRERR